MNGNRRYARQVVTPRLYVSMNGSSAGGILYDVSLGGLSLDVVGPTPAVERVLLNFDLSETGDHFEGAGLIIWKSELGSRVGIQFADLPEASHLKIKTWLSAKFAAGSGAQNVIVQDRMDATFLEQAAVLPERAFNSDASTTTATRTVREAPRNKQQEIANYVDRIPPRPPVALPRVEERSNAARAESHEREIRELRSSFFPPLGTEPHPEPRTAAEEIPRDWKRVLQWTLAGVFVVVAVLMLAMVIKIASSPQFDAGLAYRAVKSNLASGVAKLMESPESQQAASSRVSSLNAQPVPAPKMPVGHDTRSETASGLNKTDANKTGADNSGGPNDRFEVTDALHGSRYLPRTSTNLIVQFQRPGGFKQVDDSASSRSAAAGAALPGHASASAPAATNLFAPESGNLQLGRVLRESSGERPVMEAMPDYPPVALQNNVQGRVVLTALISKNGTLKDVRILSSPSVLDSTVLEAVRTWRYKPHYENGVPVEAVTEIVVDFSITSK